MAEVITQVEMMKFAGMEKAIFSAGTILTPSAKDWAKEHKIDVILGENPEKQVDSKSMDTLDIEKSELLKRLVNTIIGNMGKAGGFLKKEEFVEVITRCLLKMGNKVEK